MPANTTLVDGSFDYASSIIASGNGADVTAIESPGSCSKVLDEVNQSSLLQDEFLSKLDDNSYQQQLPIIGDRCNPFLTESQPSQQDIITSLIITQSSQQNIIIGDFSQAAIFPESKYAKQLSHSSSHKESIGSHQLLISNFDKKHGFQKEVRFIQINNTTPSISQLPPIKTRSEITSTLNQQGRKVGVLRKQKQIETDLKLVSRSEFELTSAHTIDLDQCFMTEEAIFQLNPNQKQAFLPKIPKQHKISEKDLFFASYKRQTKLSQFEKKYKFSSGQNQFNYLHQKNDEQNLLPKTFKVFSEYSDITRAMDLKGQGIGNFYSASFAETLKFEQLKHLRKLGLADNNLNCGSMNRIFKQCPSHLYNLDISKNPLNQECITGLFKPLFVKTKLSILNLSSCGLGDTGFSELYQQIKENSDLKVLDLSINKLSEQSAVKLRKLLEFNSTLNELYLRWNRLLHEGGVQILNGVIENTNLKVIDLSHNAMRYQEKKISTINQTTSTAALIQHILKKESCELMHFDVSFNEFSDKECQIIAQGLQANKLLYGFHFQGNANYYIDQFGFLQKRDELTAVKLSSSELEKKPINSLNPVNIYRKLYQDENEAEEKEQNDVCWICQGWQEVVIKATDITCEPLFLHLNYSDFKPILIQKNEEGDYEKHVMVPRDCRVDFFFSNPLESSKSKVSKNYETNGRSFSKSYNYEFSSENTTLSYIFVYQVNSIQSGEKLFFEGHESYKIMVTNCQPRESALSYTIPTNQWAVSKSIWRDFRNESQDNLAKCLEFDIQNSRTAKLIKNPNDLQVLKQFVLNNGFYALLKEAYKWNSAIQPHGDIFCIGSQVFHRLIQKTKILEGGKLKTADIDRVFIATNFNPNDAIQDNNPLKALVRYEFLEIFLRIAHEKYPLVSYTEAFKTLCENDIQEHLLTYPLSNDWRVNQYWCCEVEQEILQEMDVVRSIYENLCAKNQACNQSTTKFVDLGTFMDFIIPRISPFIEVNSFTEISLRTIFYLSFQCYVDDVNSENHKQMGLLEFIEAISRTSQLVFPDNELQLRAKVQRMIYEISDQNVKHQINRRKKARLSHEEEEHKKQMKQIIFHTRKDYNIKQYIPVARLNKYKKVKLFSHQPKFLPFDQPVNED